MLEGKIICAFFFGVVRAGSFNIAKRQAHNPTESGFLRQKAHGCEAGQGSAQWLVIVVGHESLRQVSVAIGPAVGLALVHE